MTAMTLPRAVALGHAAATVEVLRGVDQIATLSAEWRALFARAAEPHQVFQSPAVLELWMRHYADDGVLPLLITGRVDGQLAVVVPLVRQRIMGLSVLRCMGMPIAQFSDCIAEPDLPQALTDQIWAAIRGLGADMLELRRVRADSTLARILPAGGSEWEHQQSPRADLAQHVGTNGEPGAFYSSKHRSNLRRRYRHLAELGEVRLINSLPLGDAPQFAVSAVNMKRLWLDRRKMLSPAVQDDRFLAFFVDAAKTSEAGLLVSAITLDHIPIAINLSLTCKGVSFGHVLASDPAYEEHGVGGLMIHQAFAAAYANGCTHFDLQAPSDSYKMTYADSTTAVTSRAFAFSPVGQLAVRLLTRGALPKAKEIASKLPAPLVSWLGRRV